LNGIANILFYFKISKQAFGKFDKKA
jgi:hypothetical protein